jgi:gas vesicle protein
MAETDKPKDSVLDRMKEKAKGMQSEVQEKIADLSEAGMDRAKEMQNNVKEKIADLSEAGMDKLKEVLAEINDMLPLIRELGYTIEGIQVGIGLIPNISLDIGGLTQAMDEEAFKRTLEEHKEKRLLVGVVRTLQATSVLQQKIKLGQMQSNSATIVLSLPPKVTLKFK